MKIAVIGASGHYGSALAAAASKECECIGCAPGPSHEGFAPPDIEPFLRAAKVRGVEVPRFSTAEALLDAMPDIAVINGWWCDNPAMIEAAARRGIHIYCEKPLATTLDGLKRVEAALAAAPKVCLGAMLEIRYAPWFAAAYEAVSAGLIGEVRMLTAQKSYKLGVRPEFYRHRALYGGTMAWVGIHAIDWTLWFSGKRLVWVDAAHSTRGNRDHGDLEVTASCLMGLEDEVIAAVHADYLHAPTAARHDDDRLRVVGTRGTVEVRDQAAMIETEDVPIRVLDTRPQPSPFLDFIGGIGGKPSRVTAADAIKATRAALLAVEAARTGRRAR